MNLLQRDSNIVSLISTELEKLLDLSINLVQQLLKKQFPSVNGLQSTLLETKPTMGICLNNQLQTIRSHGNHWVVASTVYRKELDTAVLVYNSVYRTPMKLLLMFKCRTSKIRTPDNRTDRSTEQQNLIA